MKASKKPKLLKKSLLDRVLYDTIIPAYSTLSHYGARYPKGREHWQERGEQTVARVQQVYPLHRRHKADEVLIEELMDVVSDLRARVRFLNRKWIQCQVEEGWTGSHVMAQQQQEGRGAELIERVEAVQQENESLQARVAKLAQEKQQLQARIAELEQDKSRAKKRRSAPFIAPAWKVNPLGEKILLLMGETGLGRAWRIAERLAAQDEGGYSMGSVRNALNRLQQIGLVKEVTERGRPRRWSGPRGGGRSKLLLLSDFGRAWYEERTGSPPAESELIWGQRRHKGVIHGVAILEVADYLRAMDMPVEMEPEPLFEGPVQGWGKRTEPDLITWLDDELWPVEVQNMVVKKKRYREKWAKSLRAAGRLMLMLYTEKRKEKQKALLRQWMRRRDWPAGEILIGSLEELIADEENWFFESVS